MASRILKEVLRRVEAWPEERQNAAAHVLIEMERQEANSIDLTDSQVKEVERRLAKPNRKFVSLETVGSRGARKGLFKP
jgi:hypothetical protein